MKFYIFWKLRLLSSISTQKFCIRSKVNSQSNHLWLGVVLTSAIFPMNKILVAVCWLRSRHCFSVLWYWKHEWLAADPPHRRYQIDGHAWRSTRYCQPHPLRAGEIGNASCGGAVRHRYTAISFWRCRDLITGPSTLSKRWWHVSAYNSETVGWAWHFDPENRTKNVPSVNLLLSPINLGRRTFRKSSSKSGILTQNPMG